MRPRTAVVVAAALISAGISAIASRPVDAAPSSDHRPLILTSFVQNGRTDVACNEVLEFKFSTKVRRGSVDWHSLQVNEVVLAGEKPAVGARIVSGNVVRFDPRRTQRNYGDSLLRNTLVTEVDHPEGFTRSATFVVRLPLQQGVSALRSRGGRRLSMPFTTTIVTSNTCLDLVEGQPEFVGDHGTGLLGFEPPHRIGTVYENAVIVLEFSEPVASWSLRPGETVLVTRITKNEQVAGTMTADPSAGGRRWWFAPAGGGFGFDSVNGIGWDIRVKLTTGITDLGGNPLRRAVTFPVFRTQSPPK